MKKAITHTLALGILALLVPAGFGAERVAGGIPLHSLHLNGSASYGATGNAIELTSGNAQAASAFTPTPMAFGPGDSFEAEIVFDAAAEFDTPPADGLTFVVQNLPAGPGFLGESGSGLGFFMSNEMRALAATFDYADNQISGTSANSVGIALTQGVDLATATPSFQLAGTSTSFRYAWITYTAKTRTMSVYVSETSTRPMVPTVSTKLLLGLSSILGGQAYFGVTAGTGDDYCLQTLEYLNVTIFRQ